jgi:hypothetical protein
MHLCLNLVHRVLRRAADSSSWVTRSTALTVVVRCVAKAAIAWLVSSLLRGELKQPAWFAPPVQRVASTWPAQEVLMGETSVTLLLVMRCIAWTTQTVSCCVSDLQLCVLSALQLPRLCSCGHYAGVGLCDGCGVCCCGTVLRAANAPILQAPHTCASCFGATLSDCSSSSRVRQHCCTCSLQQGSSSCLNQLVATQEHTYVRRLH